MAATCPVPLRPLQTLTYRAIGGLVSLVLSLGQFGAEPAFAQQDPANCFQSGPTIILSVFLADGVTGAGASPLRECESIVYRVDLLKAGDDTVCAFRGGSLLLTTPDGVLHDLTPPGGVPCLGGLGDNGSTCNPGEPPASGIVPYTVRPQDITAGSITAQASYVNGFLLDAVVPTAGVSAATPKSTPVQVCSDGLVCNGIETCNPMLPDGVRLGACETGTAPVCMGNECNDAACQEPTGCVLLPRPAGTACADTDGDICTLAACRSGACDQAYAANASIPACVCGNGLPDPGESCDDGNTDDGVTDNCRNNCTRPICGDPARIKFRQAPKNDFFKVFGRIDPAPPFDPLGKPISFELRNANGTIVQFSLPPNALVAKGKGWSHSAKGVDKLPGSGISALKIGRHQDAFTFTLKAYGDLGAAELPAAPAMMDGTLTIGTEQFTTSGAWERVRSGWVLDIQNAIPMCQLQ